MKDTLTRIREKCIDTQGYAMNGRAGSMHKFLLGKREGKEIDHINQNKADNRRSNLRFVSKAINNGNRKTKNAYQLRSGRWQSYISIKNRMKTLGTYDTQEEAQVVANRAKLALCEENND